jgi:hypothetical protein
MATHLESPAYNVCPTESTAAQSFNLNCSLVCYLGRPFQSGFLQINLFRKDCGSNPPAETFLYQPDTFQVGVNCDPNFDDTTPLNPNWVGTAGTVTNQGIGYGYRIRFDTRLTAIRVPASGIYGVRDRLELTVGIYRLMPAVTPYWAECSIITLPMGEIVTASSNDPYSSKYYESDLTQVTFDVPNCTGDVDFIRANLTLFPYRFGCSIYDTEGSQKCALYSDRDGFKRSYTCLMALVTPYNRNTWTPQLVQMGYNSTGCGAGANPACGCYEWGGTTLVPPIATPTNLTVIGCPNESPSTNTQQIQYGIGGVNSTGGSYEIILKTINRGGSICVAARLAGTPSYTIGTFTILQETEPFIAVADFSTLPDHPVIYFYGYEFPSATIKDCIEDHENTGVLPFDLFDNDSGDFGIQIEAGTFDVLGYNAVSIGNIIGYQPSIVMYANVFPVLNDERQKVQQMISENDNKKPQNPLSSGTTNQLMERYKNPCKYFHEEVIEKDGSCGCSSANIYKCDIYGKCKRLTNKLKEELPVCVSCDKYEKRINLL